MVCFSELFAKVLTKAWQQNDEITSEQVASVLYYDGRPIPKSHQERSKMIRNAIMTLKRMQGEGLIASVKSEREKNIYRVKEKNKLRSEILGELRELFGKDFV